MITFLTNPVLAFSPQIATPTEQDEQEAIKSVIQAYFEIRYVMLNTLQLVDFGNLISKSDEGKSFLQAESGKLKIQIKSAEVFQLRYSQYDFYLDL